MPDIGAPRGTNDPLLTYTGRPRPEQLPVDGIGAVDITVRNNTGKLQTVDKVVFTIPVGEGEDHLTAPGNVKDIKVVLPSEGWSNDTPMTKVFTMAPDDKTEDIPEGGELVFTLGNIVVNSVPGNPKISVDESLKGQQPKNTALPCTKFRDGFTLSDFLPSSTSVPAGTQAQVIWKCRNRTSETVTLYYTGGPELGVPVGGAESWKGTVWNDTAFTLVARQGAAIQALHTFVTVAEPHLTVRNLTVRDRARLLRRPKPETQTPLTPPPEPMGQPAARTYAAGTDGLLVGSVQTFSATATADLTIAVTTKVAQRRERNHGKDGGAAAAHTQTTRVRARGAHDDVHDPGVPIAVPVPDGSTVTITWHLADSGKPTPYQHFAPVLRWQPFGVGALTPI